MRTLRLCLYSLLFLFSASCAQQPSTPAKSANLSGSWEVQVMDKHHKVVSTMTVSFSSQPANSCMSGSWKQVVVTNYRTEDGDFFPGSEPLAYALDGNRLSIGRVNACDAYMMLGGELAGNRVEGEYSAVSIGGGELLGYFNAEKN